MRTKTLAGVCRECWHSARGDPALKIEALILAALNHVFPCIKFCKGNRRGFECQTQIRGEECMVKEPAPKRGEKLPIKDHVPITAIPDTELLLSKRSANNKHIDLRIGNEIDEKRHDDRLVECELGRLDTLFHGVLPLIPMILIRFNPHTVEDQVLPDLIDRVRELLQVLRDICKDFEACEEEDINPTLRVRYLFYGEGSKHIEFARLRGNLSFSVMDDINVTRAKENMDVDIAAFTFSDLDEEFTARATSDLVQLAIQAKASRTCCTATSIGGKQCSQGKKKGSDLCKRHYDASEKTDGKMTGPD